MSEKRHKISKVAIYQITQIYNMPFLPLPLDL